MGAAATSAALAGLPASSGQVCPRIDRRLRELRLADVDAHRRYLEATAGEWEVLDEACRITISRFSSDRGVFAALAAEVLPALARGRDSLAAWSAGCASGEEPYTLVLLWQHDLAPRSPGVGLRVLATDVDEAVLRRAQAARYPASSLKELPPEWLDAFVRRGDVYELAPEHRRAVEFRRHDLRSGPPDGPFDLVLCRNLAFTYFDAELQHNGRPDLEVLVAADERYAVVVPADAIELVAGVAEDLDHLADPPRLSGAARLHHDPLADVGQECGRCPHCFSS